MGLSSNQITGFFDLQYLWKQSIDILDFLHGDNCQGKVTSEITTLVACGHLSLIPPISLQDSLIINFSGKNKFMSCFFHGVGHQEKALLLLVGCSQLCLSCNQIIRFFDQQYLLITT